MVFQMSSKRRKIDKQRPHTPTKHVREASHSSSPFEFRFYYEEGGIKEGAKKCACYHGIGAKSRL